LSISNLTPDPAEIPLNLWELDPGSSLAKYGVDSMMHHQLNKLTDLTPDPSRTSFASRGFMK